MTNPFSKTAICPNYHFAMQRRKKVLVDSIQFFTDITLIINSSRRIFSDYLCGLSVKLSYKDDNNFYCKMEWIPPNVGSTRPEHSSAARRDGGPRRATSFTYASHADCIAARRAARRRVPCRARAAVV